MCTRFLLLLLLLIAAVPTTAAEQATITVPLGQLVEDISCLSDASQTYTLYLPSSYTRERQWPALLIFDPRGRSVLAAELFIDAAERWGWLLISSNDTRSDGPMEPNHRAINALWPEVHSRYAIDPQRLYAAGFSGGAHLAYMVGKSTGGLAGIIASGCRPLTDQLEGTDFAMFAAAGNRDFNYAGTRTVDEVMARQGNPHRLEIFDDVHRWMPAKMAGEAIAWMELVAMQRGLRPKDLAVAGALYADDLAAAQALEGSGELLRALDRYRMMVRTYGNGLADTAAAQAAVARLEGSDAVVRAEKELARWLAYEKRMRHRFAKAYGRLQGRFLAMTPARLRSDLGLAELQDGAKKNGVEGMTNRRLLATLYSELSFYLMRDLMAEHRWQHLVTVLTVATEVYDQEPATWYNLACAHARSDQPDQAITALQRAVDMGYRNPDWLQSDPDLASLHQHPGFKAIVTRLAGADG